MLQLFPRGQYITIFFHILNKNGKFGWIFFTHANHSSTLNPKEDMGPAVVYRKTGTKKIQCINNEGEVGGNVH